MSVVFTNGCFDLLHLGHIDYLSRAKNLGGMLIVAVNSDDSVKRLDKGLNRPIQDQDSRAGIIAALHSVDAVVVFSEDTPMELLEELKPDVLVKGGDYSRETVVGADLVEENGGRVEIIPFLEGHSTSNIENRILGKD